MALSLRAVQPSRAVWNTPVRCTFSQCPRPNLPVARRVRTFNRGIYTVRGYSTPGHPPNFRQQTRFISSNREKWTPPDTSSRPVAVLGGGVLGRRIACAWVAAGYEVVLVDLNEGQRNAATDYLEHNIDDFSKITGNTRTRAKFTTVSRWSLLSRMHGWSSRRCQRSWN
jgi:hypothetical protein